MFNCFQSRPQSIMISSCEHPTDTINPNNKSTGISSHLSYYPWSTFQLNTSSTFANMSNYLKILSVKKGIISHCNNLLYIPKP